MDLSIAQERAITLATSGESVLVTGQAGTGKSAILRELKRRLGRKLQVCATTGIAAINVGGCTMHRFFGIGLGERSAYDIADDILSSENEWGDGLRWSIRNAKWVAIDEISMCSAKVFQLVDEVCQLVRDNDNPFGGITLVMFGDFLQLPPVNGEFAFLSSTWRKMGIKTVVLEEVFRQEDREFAEILGQIRVGKLTWEGVAMLKSRLLNPVDENPELEAAILFTHNADVDKINCDRLMEIGSGEVVFRSVNTGSEWVQKLLDKSCMAPDLLRLKVGCRVMLLDNMDTKKGLANGSMGHVVGFESARRHPVVSFDCGETVTISSKKTWEYREFDTLLGERPQLPLKLAYAITIHKSQGMTLDKMRVSLKRCFEFGQAYVALSRARTLGGLFIENSRRGIIKAHPEAVKFYQGSG